MLTDTVAIGQRIKALRKKQHLTQSELAKKLGKALRTVQKYEKGEIEVAFSVINDIAAALGVSLSELLGVSVDVPIDYTECWLEMGSIILNKIEAVHKLMTKCEKTLNRLETIYKNFGN